MANLPLRDECSVAIIADIIVPAVTLIAVQSGTVLGNRAITNIAAGAERQVHVSVLAEMRQADESQLGRIAVTALKRVDVCQDE